MKRILLLGVMLLIDSMGVRAQTPTPAPQAAEPASAEVSININDLSVHDPYILRDDKTHTYMMYKGYSPPRASAPSTPGQVKAQRAGVLAYVSKDLKTWTGPKVVFEMPVDFWCDTNSGPWAPEVHPYNDKYYLFTTFNATSQRWGPRNGDGPPMNKRASQILVGDSPLGPFKPFFNHPTTPDGQMTLDATLYVEDGQPWIVYCHEWVQTENGSIDAIRLKPDLSETVGTTMTLLHAADFDWTANMIEYRGTWPGRVTDGPEFYRMKNGTLAMLWSSHSEKHLYAQAIAYSHSGKLAGPWTHPAEPLLWDDRGHGMFFKDFDGNLRLCLFRYFRGSATRVQIWDVEDAGDQIKVKEQLLGAK